MLVVEIPMRIFLAAGCAWPVEEIESRKAARAADSHAERVFITPRLANSQGGLRFSQWPEVDHILRRDLTSCP